MKIWSKLLLCFIEQVVHEDLMITMMNQMKQLQSDVNKLEGKLEVSSRPKSQI